jgi:hypothetical protein
VRKKPMKITIAVSRDHQSEYIRPVILAAR